MQTRSLVWKLCLLLMFISSTLCEKEENVKAEREEKFLSMFQVVKFPNDQCQASNSRLGTCYTSSECQTKGGVSDGSCAQGFGVCCTFFVNCGSTSSQNGTILDSSISTSPNCSSTICKAKENICQIRLDFANFVISGPSTVTESVSKALMGVVGGSGSPVTQATQCLTDVFTVTGTSSVPVLCGTLTNDHIYVEPNENCIGLNFNINEKSTTRSWNIKVTQYNCDYSNLAPQGCLQYFFGQTTGTVRSFNYAGSPPFHLANQKQSICVRREKGICQICWTTVNVEDFQLSGTAAMGYTKGSECCAYNVDGLGMDGYDCVMIPGATSAGGKMLPQSYCGRSKGLVKPDGTTPTSVCSKSTPFQLDFFSDNWEFEAESKKAKGFQLAYNLMSC